MQVIAVNNIHYCFIHGECVTVNCNNFPCFIDCVNTSLLQTLLNIEQPTSCGDIYNLFMAYAIMHLNSYIFIAFVANINWIRNHRLDG